MNEHRKNLILLFAALFVLQTASAGSFIFHNLSEERGLTDHLVNVIHQDCIGQIWLGTASNVVRYDGVHCFEYMLPGAKSRNKRVQDIASAPDLTIWAGNGDGLWRLLPHDTAFVQVWKAEIAHPVNALALDSSARHLFVGTDCGVYDIDILKDKITRSLINPNELSSENIVNDLMLETDGVLWAAAEEGLHSWTKASGNWQHYYAVDNSKQGFRHLAKTSDRIFLGSLNSGLFYFEESQNSIHRYINLDCPVVYDLCADTEGQLFVGTDGSGVYKIDIETDRIIQQFSQGSGASDISSNSVYSVLCNERGQLWVGSYQSGVDYSLYQSSLISTFATPGFDTQPLAVRAFAKHGYQYMIGYRGGLCFVDTDRGLTYPMGPKMINCQMIFSLCYLDGLFYIGTYGGGMFTFNPLNMTLQPFAPSGEGTLTEAEIFCITIGPDSTLWAGTGGGLYHFGRDGRRLNHFSSKNSVLPQGNVYEVFFDSSRRGWVCTESGLCVYDELSNSLRTDIFRDGFIDKQKIRDIFEDSQHRLIFVPDQGDLTAWDLSLQAIDLADLIPHKISDAMFVYEHPKGKLWVGTQHGLYSFGSKAQSYNFADGLNSMAFTFCQPIVDEEQRLWLGSEAGLLYIDEEPDTATTAKTSRYITGLLIDGNKMQVALADLFKDKHIFLTTKPLDITFLLSELSYTSEKAMRYEYKLDGVDDDWIQLNGSSEVTYHALRWGNRTFRLRNSAFPEQEQVLQVRIPYSASDIIKLALLLLTLTLIAALVWYIVKWQLPRHKAAQNIHEDEEEDQEANGDRLVKTTTQASNRSLERRDIKSGVDEEWKENDSETDFTPVEKDKYHNVNLSMTECKRLADALELQMKENKLYLNPDLKIADVSAAINTTPYLMSYVLSQHLKISFYDYINNFRVEEFKSLASASDLSMYTLPALGERCGFSSRAAFFRNFKKLTSLTPNEYVQGLSK